jgi:enoyl-CoA hydratase/carnithine racemase
MARIATLQLSPGGYADLLGSPQLDDLLAADDPLRLILLDGAAGDDDELPHPGSLPVIIAALGPTPAGAGAVDLTVDPAEAELLADAVAANPIAATSLALLLRAAEAVRVDNALALESATYSMLQAGGEFAAWRERTSGEPYAPDAGPTVLLDRDGDHLTITLNRPHRHNAVTTRLRDELCQALDVALHDRSVAQVTLVGAGRSFCTGGDLAEFGARADPAAAHLVRLTRSPARQLHRLAARLGPGLHARIHGHALGGGIEMAAFCPRVTAAADTVCGLPEVGLGLIPGAGGTVSVARRIGRQRTAWLGLTGQTVDATTAHAWGLVDALDG